ncbi:hydrolase [Mucilaginibacter sp. PPCGB 2223]|uniref:alpha/beta hydrolase n=1 Tax=Mucilaginibacter sp. PPCGB 2223 TaxID=1886027 RepID=UPI0008246EDE|nr:alpha/beta fold hydrolase [Mucilaginibacter sp. PPCGB 2223]OCX52939.1 hydrolase [Mucilaginibacter sp. PPCGB 2223]
MIKKETYTIPGAKGRNMLADLTFNSAHPDAPLVIFVHGFKGFKDWGAHNLVANYFASNGFRFLKFNFSHNGTTPDNPTEFTDLIAFADNTFSIELDDLKYMIDFACSGSAIPAAKTVNLIGHSMGGGVSIITAANDKRVEKLITFASISGFRKLWPHEAEKQWRIQGIRYIENARTGQQMPLKVSLLADLDHHPVKLNIAEQAGRVKQPWLITHGDEDKSVPLKHAEELKEAQPNAQLMVMHGADHVYGASQPYLGETLPEHLALFCDEAVRFFKTGTNP